jgi:hypothetical protein
MPINTENPIQIIRGDKASISARTGKDGEPNWATDTHELYIHDGVTPGGHRVGGGQEVDGVTIAKSESDVISVIPSGIIDNDTIVLDASGKISTKSIPFDKPSDNRWHQSNFIFSAVANTAVTVNATNLEKYDTSATNSVLFEPNSSGQLICRKTGLYGVRVEFSPYYAGEGSTLAMDGWFYIKLNNIDIGSSGTPVLAAANEPNVFTCYVNRRIEAGQIISTAWNIPYTGNVNINYIDYQFTYFPVTNEYQISDSELNDYYDGGHSGSVLVQVYEGQDSTYDVGEFQDIDFKYSGRKFTEKLSDGTVKILEDGLYFLQLEIAVDTSSDTGAVLYDYQIGIQAKMQSLPSEEWAKLCTNTISAESQVLNPDVSQSSIVRRLSAGDIIRPYIHSGVTLTFSIYHSDLQIVKFPSLADASTILPFTAPTADAPGKEGLVPAPEATPENELLNRFLSAKGGWSGIDLCALHPTAQSAELNKVLLDMGGVSGEGVNIDTLLRSGFFTANAFAGTLPDGITGGVLINIMAIGDDGLYYGQQILISYINYRLYFRGNITGIQPGGIINWYPWSCLTPIPQTAAGVGQWGYLGSDVSLSVTLPAGGVYAYFLTGFVSASGVIDGTISGIAAGGTVITLPAIVADGCWGFKWRIA